MVGCDFDGRGFRAGLNRLFVDASFYQVKSIYLTLPDVTTQLLAIDCISSGRRLHLGFTAMFFLYALINVHNEEMARHW